MSIAVAALYGDLVKYLRDRWAEQAAQFNETSFAAEFLMILFGMTVSPNVARVLGASFIRYAALD